MDNNGKHDEYLLKIQKTQKEFYSNQAKKHIFKNAQKTECANYVSTNVKFEHLIESTAFIVPNTNIVYFNYLVFKTYGSPENAKPIYAHITALIESILTTYESYELHVNLKTFSVSACHRYYSMIVSSIESNSLFTEKLNKLVIYHTPFVIDQVTVMLYQSIKPFLNKIEYVKEKSEERIAQLFKDVV
jgi:hypothetical protein